MDFTKRTIFKIFAKKRAASKGRFYTFRRNTTRFIATLTVPQEQYTLHSNSTRSVGTIHGSLALVRLPPCFTPWHFFCFYNQLIYSGLQTCYRTQYGRVSE